MAHPREPAGCLVGRSEVLEGDDWFGMHVIRTLRAHEVAIEQGLSVPTKGPKEGEAMTKLHRAAGGALLGTKDRETNEWMPAAALARLAEEYPKQNKSQAPSSKCPKNDPLVEVFDELAVLERKAGTEGFKISAYKKAAVILRDLDFEVPCLDDV
ncbi:hypothetical protein CYMTET_23632 [Cymbomonas tetramitiformis]|uniref:DNA polymerase beta-like N-terminal domain-containing protein n=1 Tax=Cymbomonas tetramitiformis TaxID=36881 RepID=A0AAE0FXF0_9CHLO|nr:hypothetical protein CYMTET_23632 [Cymbomonas tetramitiformis]